jgi:hypothetical protein
VKGCGEAGAIAAPAAVINALTRCAWRPIGVKRAEMPATLAQAVWTVDPEAPSARLRPSKRFGNPEVTMYAYHRTRRPSPSAVAVSLNKAMKNPACWRVAMTLIPTHEAAARAARATLDRPRRALKELVGHRADRGPTTS